VVVAGAAVVGVVVATVGVVVAGATVVVVVGAAVVVVVAATVGAVVAGATVVVVVWAGRAVDVGLDAAPLDAETRLVGRATAVWATTSVRTTTPATEPPASATLSVRARRRTPWRRFDRFSSVLFISVQSSLPSLDQLRGPVSDRPPTNLGISSGCARRDLGRR
jgi:hypothetical protein